VRLFNLGLRACEMFSKQDNQRRRVIAQPPLWGWFG
jgi:hypothetical protein